MMPEMEGWYLREPIMAGKIRGVSATATRVCILLDGGVEVELPSRSSRYVLSSVVPGQWFFQFGPAVMQMEEGQFLEMFSKDRPAFPVEMLGGFAWRDEDGNLQFDWPLIRLHARETDSEMAKILSEAFEQGVEAGLAGDALWTGQAKKGEGCDG